MLAGGSPEVLQQLLHQLEGKASARERRAVLGAEGVDGLQPLDLALQGQQWLAAALLIRAGALQVGAASPPPHLTLHALPAGSIECVNGSMHSCGAHTPGFALVILAGVLLDLNRWCTTRVVSTACQVHMLTCMVYFQRWRGERCPPADRPFRHATQAANGSRRLVLLRGA
jgi:hypothetical protein